MLSVLGLVRFLGEFPVDSHAHDHGMMLEASRKPEGQLGQALAIAITSAADVTFKEVIAETIGKRDLITQWITRAGDVQKSDR